MANDQAAIEAIYPLSPLQQGLLFYSMYQGESGAYTGQFTCVFKGGLEVSALERAWRRVVERHGAFRTLFKGDRLDEPIQIVCKQARLPWRQYDWRAMEESERERRLEEFLRSDRALAFDLSKPPLMRLALIRLGDDRFQFVWSYHHLLMDGWSEALVYKELLEFYDAFSRGVEPPCEPARLYADYIAWLKRQDLSQAETFWREALRDFSPPAHLSLDRLRGASSDRPADFQERYTKLSASITARLSRFARRHQLTLNTIMQGCWALLLSRYSGGDDVIFGTVVSGRPPDLAGVESIVGLFLNTLPVRVRLAPDAELGPWLKAIQERQVEARQYEYSPLVEVHRWAGAPRSQPLFETILIFENYPEYAPVHASGQSGGAQAQIVDVRDAEHTDFPLTLVARPGHELSLKLEYDRRRFDEDAVDCLLAHITQLLESFVEEPRRRLCDFTMLTEAERRRFLDDPPDQPAEARGETLQRLFERQAQERPADVALNFQGRQMTYRQLNARGNQLAHGLAEFAMAPNRMAAILAGAGPEQIIAMIGVSKAGAAFVCLDPADPPSRLNQILEEMKPSCLICDAASLAVHELMFQELAREMDCRIVSVEECADLGRINGSPERRYDVSWLSGFPDSNPEIKAKPADMVYIVYTSGSTGQPKGIMQSHNGLCQLIGWLSRQFDIGPGKRIGQWAATTYDAAYAEIFAALCFGATLHLTTTEVKGNPHAALNWAKSERLNLLQTVPSFCRQMLAEAPAGELALPDLEFLLLAGEVMQVDLACEWLERFSRKPRLFNLYGPTECMLATYYEVEQADRSRAYIPVGRAIDGRRIIILDKQGRLCPAGVTGEIYIRSPFLTLGYFQRPEETRKGFIPNPLTGQPNDLVYRTGDLGRWAPDGNLEFCGRIDHQVKIRGRRVELEEIESALSQHRAVRECVVSVRDAGAPEQRLIAHLAVTGGVSTSTLRDFLGETLPDYMIPSTFVFLDALPRTHSGKVDRKNLPAPADQQPESRDDYVAPRDGLEQLIAEVWRELLRVERIGVFDDFFELGGHSLLTAQMLNKLRQLLSIEYPVTEFFEAPTVAALAGGIAALQTAQEHADKFARVFARVSQLPDEELSALLKQKRALAEQREA